MTGRRLEKRARKVAGANERIIGRETGRQRGAPVYTDGTQIFILTPGFDLRVTNGNNFLLMLTS